MLLEPALDVGEVDGVRWGLEDFGDDRLEVVERVDRLEGIGVGRSEGAAEGGQGKGSANDLEGDLSLEEVSSELAISGPGTTGGIGGAPVGREHRGDEGGAVEVVGCGVHRRHARGCLSEGPSIRMVWQ